MEELKKEDEIFKIFKELQRVFFKIRAKIIDKDNILYKFEKFCSDVLYEKTKENQKGLLNKQELENVFFTYYIGAVNDKFWKKETRMGGYKVEEVYDDEYYFVLSNFYLAFSNVVSEEMSHRKYSLIRFGFPYVLKKNGFKDEWVQEAIEYKPKSFTKDFIYNEYIENIENGIDVELNTEKAMIYQKSIEELYNHYKNL